MKTSGRRVTCNKTSVLNENYQCVICITTSVLHEWIMQRNGLGSSHMGLCFGPQSCILVKIGLTLATIFSSLATRGFEGCAGGATARSTQTFGD
jgi:hypothetical protein